MNQNYMYLNFRNFVSQWGYCINSTTKASMHHNSHSSESSFSTSTIISLWLFEVLVHLLHKNSTVMPEYISNSWQNSTTNSTVSSIIIS